MTRCSPCPRSHTRARGSRLVSLFLLAGEGQGMGGCPVRPCLLSPNLPLKVGMEGDRILP
jgi:hypothetical protein